MMVITRTLMSLALAGSVATAAVVGTSSAATFDVVVCADAPSLAAAAVAANSHPNVLATTSACRSDPVNELDGLAATDRSGAPNAPAGASASWSVGAAQGTRIVAARVRRFLGKRSDSWQVWSRTGEGLTLESCQVGAGLSCSVGALPTSPTAITRYSGLDTQALIWGVECRPALGDCSTGTSLRSAWAIVYGLTLSVDDPAPPQLQSPTGSLFSGAAWHSGTEQATVQATDAAGVRRLELLVDGVVVGARDEVCDFAQMRPCPAQGELTLSLDVADLGEGGHHVAANATDAAGQRSSTVSVPIVVDTRAPTPPVGIRADRNADGTITVVWSNPDQGTAAPIAAVQYQFCPLGSDSGCVGSGIVGGSGIHELRIRPPAGGAPWDLVVWLQDAAGHADRGLAARVTVPPSTSEPDPRGREPGPSRARRAATQLKIVGLSRRGRWLRVRGRAKTAFSGRIRVAFRRTRQGRPIVRKTAVVRRGRFVAQLDVGQRRSLAGGLVAAYFSGSRDYRASTAVRAVKRSRGGGSS